MTLLFQTFHVSEHFQNVLMHYHSSFILDPSCFPSIPISLWPLWSLYTYFSLLVPQVSTPNQASPQIFELQKKGQQAGVARH